MKKSELVKLIKEVAKEIEPEHQEEFWILKNGKKLTFSEEHGPGMAGEPMCFLSFYVDGKQARFSQFKNLLKPEDFKEVKSLYDDINDYNEAIAIKWVE